LNIVRIPVLCLAFGVVASGACSKQPPADPAQAAAPVATSQSTPTAAQAPPPPGAQEGVQTVTGTVVETMNAASYTYVRVKSSTGEIWAASMQFPVAVGDKVVVPLETPMQNFRSASLNRVFPLIYFSSRIAREGEMAPPPLAAAHGASGGSLPAATPSAATPAAAVTELIAPADGGMSVASVWAKRASFAGKPVTVRGKVVKFNGGILGTNWLHIQDGSGSAKDGTNDLTVTTDGMVKVGEIITATGKVAIDKDFGAGYSYKVIVEQAAVVRK
jgi:hypothetical protein